MPCPCELDERIGRPRKRAAGGGDQHHVVRRLPCHGPHSQSRRRRCAPGRGGDAEPGVNQFRRTARRAGLVLLPVYVGATALGSRYFALGGHQHYRRAALATLAAVGIATLVAAIADAVPR